MNYGWLKGLICSICLVVLPGAGTAAPVPEQLIVVKSSDNSYFEQTINSLRRRIEASIPMRVVAIDDLDEVTPDPKNLFVTLGQKAAEAIDGLEPSVAAIHSYITHEQHQELGTTSAHSSVLLDQPLLRYLAFCKLVLDIDTLGIIERRSLPLEAGVSTLLAQQQLNLTEYRVDDKNKLLPVLRRLLQQEDALLMLPRQSIYNRDSLKGVLLTGYRNRKPVISYSPAHVKSGALASIYSSPIDIGHHLALMIERRLARQKSNDFEYALFYSIALNSRVARALDIKLPDKASLRSQLDRIKP